MKKIYLLFALMLVCHPAPSHAKDTKPVVEDSVIEDDETTDDEVTGDEATDDEGDEAKEGDADADEAHDAHDATEEDDTKAGDKADDAEKTEALPEATKTPMVGKVGTTIGVAINESGKQDFNFDLPKGQFTVYVDAQRIGDGSLTSSIDSSLKLLKRNGAALPQYSGDLIYWNSHEKEYRVGKAFSFAAPTGVRLRLTNQSDGENNFWLTVVPAAPFKFLPYGFGAKVLDAKIGPSNGTGGTLESREFAYIRAKMPAGKWSVSLGAQEAEGRVYASLLSRDERGLDYTQSFSLITSAGEYGGEAREEKIITLTKPKTLIFRVYNEGAASRNPITYDVTIEPAEK